MNDLSRLADMAEILGAIIVVGGVFFAVMQMRQIRQQRREIAAIELFRFFGSPAFTDAYHKVMQLPDGLGKGEIRQRYPECENAAMLIATTMENIGVMVFHRIVPSIVVYNLIGSSTMLLWRKLEHWVKDIRVDADNPSSFEWFQWLSTMLENIDVPDRPPAFEAYKDWKPRRTTHEI